MRTVSHIQRGKASEKRTGQNRCAPDHRIGKCQEKIAWEDPASPLWPAAPPPPPKPQKPALRRLPLSGSRVGGWRASFRVRWHVRRFRSGPQSGSPGRVSSPPLIKPDVRISRIRLSDGIMPPHVAQSGVSEHCVALIGSRQWPCPAPFLCRSRSQAPFLGRRYPASSVVRACPPPCRPGLVLADFRLASTRHRQGFPCCCAFHLPCMPTPLPRRKRTGASAACFPDRHRSSPNLRRVDSRIALFEACSAFTRVPACMVAEPPEAALLHQSASVYIVTSVNRSGCYQPKRQLLSGFRTRKENAPFHGARRVGGWRASFRVRWHVRRFRSGPQSGSPGRVSSPPLIKPDVRISRIRLSDGIMPPHVAQSGVSEHCVALIGSRQWPCPAPFLCRSRSQAPFLGRRYPASSVVRACPPPCRPGLVLADFRLASTRHRQGFPCCCAFHLPCMPTPLPRRKRTGASAACFPDRHRSSPNLRRVDSRIALFEACSAFTRVPACMVAEPPEAALLHQSASVYIVTSVNRSGCYQPKRQLLSGFRTRKENAPFHGALRNAG